MHEEEAPLRNATDFSYADNPDLPRAALPSAEKHKLLAFMRTSGELFCATAGHFNDATTGKPVEDRSWGWYRAGGWQWSGREIYHVENYDLALDPAFVSYALAR